MPINYKHYHPDWKKVIRPAILMRSFGYCEFCNVKNGSVIIRGELNGRGVYQDWDGAIFDAKNSEYLKSDYLGTVGDKPFTTIVLTIAHLDHNVNNNDYSNLKALCQRCHLSWDAEHHAKTRRANRALKQPQLF